jgi:hypothetical protein
MGEKIVIGPIDKGIRKDRTAFNIDNDSFPTLINAYQWRGRIKRKRGTSLLGRLSRFLAKTDGAGNRTINITPIPIASGIVSFTIGTDIFYDPGGANPVTLLTNSSGSAVLDRIAGTLTILGSKASTAILYFPTLPVMGLEDLDLTQTQFPGNLAFDTTYSYNISTAFPYNIWDVSFYKNPAADSVNLPTYVPKSTPTPLNWNGQNYQQFWSTNYQGALWVTNGIDVEFTGSAIGMQFKPITGIPAYINAPPGVPNGVVADLTIVGHGLVVGDFVFVNEVQGITGINFQSGYVVQVLPGLNDVNVIFPFSKFTGAYSSGGIAQYLTSNANPAIDCLRWYDGDPTNGSTTNQMFVQGNGWVNFSPPLSQAIYSISDLPAAQYYLVGARLMLPFKDRLLFFGPVIQSSTGSPKYLQDTVIYSQNGTPYYTASYTNIPNDAIDTPVSAGTTFHPILVPINQTATSPAWFEDQTGFGGFATAGISQEITTVGVNEDALIVGFNRSQTRFLYTGNDIVPFVFYLINSELGSSSTFSTIIFDQGVMTRGHRGIVVTSQTSCSRIDSDVIDQVFEMSLNNNGTERITSQRDFINEWVYLTYCGNQNANIFPTQTLQYNYRDLSWAIFNESYTTYGTFRPTTGLTWAILPADLTWETWNDPWNSSSSNLRQPVVIAGNQQGFIVFRAIEDSETSEATSLTIQNISSSTITCPNHCLNQNDYIIISGVLGTIASSVNGKVFSVATIPDLNSFTLNPSIGSGTYQGGGLITRIYNPFIQTKQFPAAWQLSRKTRLGPQQYLLSTTPNAQITLLIFLSQNSGTAYNNPEYPFEVQIIPSINSQNNSLIYSTVLYTCPESTNLGLTPANINLQISTAQQQAQTWHRMNTSLIGDTVQIGFTMNDTQLRALNDDGTTISQFAEIELHSIILDVQPSQMLV